jgi:hypothetical protein
LCSVPLRVRRGLFGLVTAAALLAALPAAASASITPSLTLSEATTIAGSSPAATFNATFSPSPTTDGVKDVTFALPPGLLANESIDGGACLISATPTAACQVSAVGSTLTVGGTSVPVSLYLVAPPKPTDVGGLALVLGTAPGTPASVADVSLGTSGLSVSFTSLPASPAPIEGMQVTLTNLRLPTNCAAANVTLTADSQQDPTVKTTTAPLTVTGCPGLPYAPKLTAAIAANSTGGAVLTLGVTQAANESANKTIVLSFPPGLAPNATNDLPCLTGAGCTIGSATATSPLVPIPLKGIVTLGGSANSPTFAVTFPAPFNLTISGVVNLSNNSVTFSNVPDVPLTSLTLDVTGPNGKPAFTTDCKPGNVGGTFTAQGGQTQTATAPIAYTGCQLKPTASGSITGLATGHPNLKLKVTRAKGAPDISSVALGLPSGLKFSRSAIVTRKVCTTKGKKKKCTTTTLIKGLGVAGGTAKSVALTGGRLVITLKKASAGLTLTVASPLVTEAKSLQTKVKKHKAGTLSFTLKVTDVKHTSTTLTLKLKAH